MGLLRLLLEYFSDNKLLCHFPSFCIHVEVCQFAAGKRIWSDYTFETHSLVRNSHQNYSIIVYFRRYQRSSVSIAWWLIPGTDVEVFTVDGMLVKTRSSML